MSMRRRRSEKQESLWVATGDLAASPGHPFYEKLNKVLAEAEFDRKVEDLCARFYVEKKGRPSIPPGVYMRMLMIGYFEGIDSERGIAWRCADSLALRRFLGYDLSQDTPDHSSLSRIRTRLDLETHQAAFTMVLTMLAEKGILSGKTLGIDATTMEANAALRSIVRRDDGRAYDEFLTDLAKASGIETPTRNDLARVDRKRSKKGSNAEWRSPVDPQARIVKMKDGSTHLAHHAEHAVDMESGAIVAATIQDATVGDPTTMLSTMEEACATLCGILEDPDTDELLRDDVATEWVADKGYHSNNTMETIAAMGCRSYISEPNRGRRRWKDKSEAQDATYGNRERLRRPKGKALMRKRGELLERSFAHTMESGAMRRAHLRGQENIRKRYLIQTAAFNLGIVMRSITGSGTPKGLWDRFAAVLGACRDACRALARFLAAMSRALAVSCRFSAGPSPRSLPASFARNRRRDPTSSTGC
jgi:transposase